MVAVNAALAYGRQLTALDAELLALDDLAQGPGLAARIADIGRTVLAEGASGLAVVRLISSLNDRLTRRVVELTARRHRLPPVAWCWLVLGSEGRQEQTFLTDQDNGLIFHAADSQEADALRALFLPFAQQANRHLAECGFALCSGDVMAGNPEWCLSLDEWRGKFIDWVRRPEPHALLNASIFFDLRPLCGDNVLGEDLRRLMLALTVDTPAFQHLMAANALQVDVPLNFRGDVVTDPQGEIDLKKFGSRIFVDAARILALAVGEVAVDTDDRLANAAPAAGMQPEDVRSVVAGFSHLLRLRLQQQVLDLGQGKLPGHGVKPALLNEVDRAILRESLRQARRLQQRLKLNYVL